MKECIAEKTHQFNQWRAQNFLWGGGRFFGNIKKFCRPFFRSANFIFRVLRKYYMDPIFLFRAPQASFSNKKQAKKALLGTFWKILTEKLRFSASASHSKIVILAPKVCI